MTVTGALPISRTAGQLRSLTIGRHGVYDGWHLEAAFGVAVGFGVGLAVGFAVGLTVGFAVGLAVGLAVGAAVARIVGAGVDPTVGVASTSRSGAPVTAGAATKAAGIALSVEPQAEAMRATAMIAAITRPVDRLGGLGRVPRAGEVRRKVKGFLGKGVSARPPYSAHLAGHITHMDHSGAAAATSPHAGPDADVLELERDIDEDQLGRDVR